MNPTLTLTPSCIEARNRFSEYLDGATSGLVMQSVAAHLETCPDCTQEFADWRAMQQVLAAAALVKTPVDLGLKLRVAISHERRRSQTRRDNLVARWENFLRPAIVQVASGLAGALVLIGGMAALVGTLAVPQSVLANDVPLGAVTMPHYLYTAAQTEPVVTRGDATIVVEADINTEGQVYDWRILSGSDDPQTRSAIDNQLILQVYEPARMFGQPVRGRVLITFSGVLVRG